MNLPFLRRFNRLKFKYKFLLAILVNIFLVLGCFALVIHNFQENRLYRNAEGKNMSLARNMAGDALEGLLVRDFLQLDVMVSSAQEAIWARYAMILDDRETVVAHSDKERLGEQLAFPDNKGVQITEVVKNGKILKEYWVPVKMEDELLGYGVLGVDHSKEMSLIHADLNDLRLKLVQVSFLIFLVGGVTAYLMAGILTKRLGLLKSRMLAIQYDNLQVEVPEVPQMVCSEFFGCENKHCPAYGHTKCWTIINRCTEGYRDCTVCPVYKQCAGDEIEELNQAFNQMVSELRDNLTKLEQANLEKSRLERLSLLGQMSAQVAHEIKNPLNAIKGSAHYLKSNFKGSILQEFLQIIETESSRLSDIVSDFLNFSKPGPPVMEPGEVRDVVRETVKLVKAEVAEKNIRLHIQEDQDPVVFSFDQAKIKQALLNLLINAVEATPDGGEIKVWMERIDGYYYIAVQDTGPGIPEEEKDNLFKPFYTTKVRGSGLGLAITEQNVRDHNGSIEIGDSDDRGAVVTIIIPV